MKIVRSEEEVRRMLKTLANASFLDCKVLMASFRTTPEFVREVLPPPLEPADDPVGSITISSVGKSNSVGSFNGGSIFLRARYKSIEGNYCLGMSFNTDTAVLFGRELYAEPKKLARVELARNGEQIVGTIERNGTELVRITGVNSGSADPKALSQSDVFHYKYTFSADGTGLDHDPHLVHVHLTNVVRVAENCEVKLQLYGNEDDVYGEIPIEEVIGGIYFEADRYGQASNIAEVDKNIFLPYAFSKVDQYDRYNWLLGKP